MVKHPEAKEASNLDTVISRGGASREEASVVL